MNEAMQRILAEVEVDPDVRCVVLTGAGKGFCAGGDVKGMASSGDGTVGQNTIDAAIHKQRVHQRATSGKLFKMPKPTIAALPGAAAGAGLSYALACDLRVMSKTAIMTMNGEVDDCLDLEATHHIHCGQTEDHRNATKAFVEKKEPVFKGK